MGLVLTFDNAEKIQFKLKTFKIFGRFQFQFPFDLTGKDHNRHPRKLYFGCFLSGVIIVSFLFIKKTQTTS